MAGPPPDAREPSPAGLRRVPPKSILILDAISVALIAWLRLSPQMDPAIANIATLVLSFLAGVTTFFWFVFFSDYARSVRLLPLAAVALAVVGAAATLRIDQVDGNLVPQFVPRWRPRHHERLERLPSAESTTADASISTHPGGADSDGAAISGDVPSGSAPSGGAPTHGLRLTGARGLLASPPGAQDYPQFLGPERTNRVQGIRLATNWVTRPPKLLWRSPIGDGWSAFSVVGGQAVTMEQRGDEEYVSCYELLTGQLLWARANRALHAEALGGVGPRATPTIVGARVFTLGATGLLQCLDLATGRQIWQRELYTLVGLTQADDEAGVAWGRSNSPLVLEDRVIVPLGGKPGPQLHSLAAFDAETGEVVWQAGQRQISYSSPALLTLGGVPQIVIVNESSVSGHRPDDGQPLWEFEWEGGSNRNASASQAVAVGDDRLFVSKGYGVGSALYRVALRESGWTATPLWQSTRVLKTKFSNVGVRDGYVYGLSEDTLECVELATGERVWRGQRYGKGQVLLVEELLLVQSETGEIALVAADPTAFRELARFTALEGVCWNNVCLAGKYLLVRNAREAACYELPLAP